MVPDDLSSVRCRIQTHDGLLAEMPWRGVVAGDQPGAHSLYRIVVRLHRQRPPHQVNMSPDEPGPPDRVVTEHRWAEILYAVPPVWPGDLGMLGVEAVDVEVLHAIRMLQAFLAVHKM